MVYDPRQDERFNKDKVFMALIKQESRFNPNATSPVGARGYTQVMPATAKSPGFGLTPNVNALVDPKQNVEFGKKYFDAMRQRYKGDEAAALVAYNGGAKTADRWVASGKNDKVIPKESADYYKIILGTKDPFAGKARVKTPDSEEAEAPKTVTGKKINVRSTEESAAATSPVAKPAVPEPTDSVADSEERTAPVVKASDNSSSDADQQSSAFDLDTSFDKVRRTPQLRGFQANFIPFANQDDPRFR